MIMSLETPTAPAPVTGPAPRRRCILVWRDGKLATPTEAVTLTVLQWVVMTQDRACCA
jgi:hypothetical protein